MLVRSSKRSVVAPARQVQTRMMRKMTIATSQQQARNVEADREELAERIARALPRQGVAEPQAGLHLSRFSFTNDRSHTGLEPCFCVIAQGAKTLTIGEDVFRYDPAHYAISTIG